ncbi:A/G-specific adenine glycosylase [Tistrella bauzanensis]|uniref:Adenine DNA glycosylase n=1 Tax=Tistrella arctica TaxID=3133430 RepID=A0ABU9YMR5_9PROT
MPRGRPAKPKLAIAVPAIDPDRRDRLRRALLDWYDRHRRVLPWRAEPGQTADPYAVWLSEIMLQQTTVAAAGPYFRAFLDLWPRVTDLAAARREAVLARWAGLGYYARARNLHACAEVVADCHGGRFPDTEAGLLELPGIGAYTAAAVASIAFDRPTVPVDGNVERVCARLFAIATPLPDAKPELRARAAQFAHDHRPGDFAQAMMDLGATLCTPRRPACHRCPWSGDCAAEAAGIADTLPARLPKGDRPVRHAVAFITLRAADGALRIRTRPDSGLLGGMAEVPGTPWEEGAPWDQAAALAHAPLSPQGWRLLPGVVVHVFTHFRLEARVMLRHLDRAEAAALDAAEAGEAGDPRWCPPEALGRAGLPSVMAKLVEHARIGTSEPGLPL